MEPAGRISNPGVTNPPTKGQWRRGNPVPSVLDLGFTKRDHRDRIRALATQAGLGATIHFVDVPADERWRRVERRNSERGETYAMQVDRHMFDFMESLWEPPEQAEWSANGGRLVAG